MRVCRGEKTFDSAINVIGCAIACLALSTTIVNPVFAADAKIDHSSELSKAMQWRPRVITSAEQELKLQAIEQSGMAYGVQLGQRNETLRLIAQLEKKADALDKIFNFQPLMLPDNLLPPVLDQADQIFSLEDGGKSFTTVAKSFRVLSDARFVTVTPTWRDFLAYEAIDVREPDPLLAPIDGAEQSIFELSIKKGYEAGILAAREIFQNRVGDLRRNYLGMLLYKQLWIQKMVDPPKVISMTENIKGDGRSMDIKTVKKIISQSVVLINDASKWKQTPLSKTALEQIPDLIK